MSGGSGPPTRWPAPWRAPYARGRVPEPAVAAVRAGPLLLELLTVLDGTEPPCASSPQAWTSEHPDDALVAAEGCACCPAQTECAAYANACRAPTTPAERTLLAASGVRVDGAVTFTRVAWTDGARTRTWRRQPVVAVDQETS